MHGRKRWLKLHRQDLGLLALAWTAAGVGACEWVIGIEPTTASASAGGSGLAGTGPQSGAPATGNAGVADSGPDASGGTGSSLAGRPSTASAGMAGVDTTAGAKAAGGIAGAASDVDPRATGGSPLGAAGTGTAGATSSAEARAPDDGSGGTADDGGVGHGGTVQTTTAGAAGQAGGSAGAAGDGPLGPLVWYRHGWSGGPVAVASRGDDKLDIFWLNEAGQMRLTVFDHGFLAEDLARGIDLGYPSLPFRAESEPAAAATGDALYVCGVATDAAIYCKRSLTAAGVPTFDDWISIAAGPVLEGTGVGLTSSDPGRIDVFWTTTEGDLARAWRVGDQPWTYETPEAAPHLRVSALRSGGCLAAPRLESWGPDRLDVVCSVAGGYAHLWLDQDWGMEHRAGPRPETCLGTSGASGAAGAENAADGCSETASNLALTTRGPGDLRVYALYGPDVIYQQYDGGWLGDSWTPIKPGTALSLGSLADGITWFELGVRRTDLFGGTPDGFVWQLWIQKD